MPFNHFQVPESSWQERIDFAKSREPDPHKHPLPHPDASSLGKRIANKNYSVFFSIQETPTSTAVGHFVAYPITEEAFEEMVNYRIKSGKDISNQHLTQYWSEAFGIYVAYIMRYDWTNRGLYYKSYAYNEIEEFLNARFDSGKTLKVLAFPSRFSHRSIMQRKGMTKIPRDELTRRVRIRKNEFPFIVGVDYTVP